jgi:hypothetical protein
MDLNISVSEILIDKMMDYYSVVTYSELASVINTTHQTISSWKQRNSVNAIKKKCKELGIYNEIFGDLNSNINNFHNSNMNKAFDFSEDSHSQDSFNINSSPLCEKITKMNQTIVASFIGAYDKLEKTGELKKLHKVLGEIEFD